MIDSDDKAAAPVLLVLRARRGKPRGTQNNPLLIWLNGGPGCSSMDGLFLELGPLRVAPGSPSGKARLERRPSSWHRAAHALFLDQPVGTGFSRTSGRNYCRDDACIVAQFETFLARFVRSYRHLVMKDEKTSVPVYFAGESHAGHYVPLMMEHLLFKATSGINWDVRGAALGNAWIDPRHQYDVSRMASTLGLISDREAARLQEKEKQCQRKLDQRVYVSKLCWDLLDDVVKATRASRTLGGPGLGANQYDARDAVRSSRFFPPGHEGVEAYMNQADVRAALHVDKESQRFRECADPPYDALQHQDGLGVAPSLRRLLDAAAHKRPRLLFYNGQTDLICNHVGVDRSLRALDWTGKRTSRARRRGPGSGGHVAGFLKRARNRAPRREGLGPHGPHGPARRGAGHDRGLHRRRALRGADEEKKVCADACLGRHHKRGGH
ncbi:peptidase [Aureococcus anophagefferens]|nr:peptidase [Aureococcus anophagefferens]